MSILRKTNFTFHPAVTAALSLGDSRSADQRMHLTILSSWKIAFTACVYFVLPVWNNMAKTGMKGIQMELFTLCLSVTMVEEVK